MTAAGRRSRPNIKLDLSRRWANADDMKWKATKLITIGLAAVMAALISGCTSSGVVAMGQDSYMISRSQWGFTGPAPIKAAALKEADDYCKKQGKVLRVTKTVEIGIKFGSTPAAEVYFKCLDTNNPELKQPATIEEITR